MLGEKALELVHETQRAQDMLGPFNEDKVQSMWFKSEKKSIHGKCLCWGKLHTSSARSFFLRKLLLIFFSHQDCFFQVRSVLEEIRVLYESNEKEIFSEQPSKAAIVLRHAALERDKRCLLAYLYHRYTTKKYVNYHFLT